MQQEKTGGGLTNRNVGRGMLHVVVLDWKACSNAPSVLSATCILWRKVQQALVLPCHSAPFAHCSRETFCTHSMGID